MDGPTTCLQHISWKTPLEADSPHQKFYWEEMGGTAFAFNNMLPYFVGSWLPVGILNCPGTVAWLAWVNGMWGSTVAHPPICDPKLQAMFHDHATIYAWEDSHGIGASNGANGALCSKFLNRYAFYRGVLELPCPPSTCPADTPSDESITAYLNSALHGHTYPWAYDPQWMTTTAAFSGLAGFHAIGLFWQIWGCRNFDGANAEHSELSGTYEGRGTVACNASGLAFPALVTGQKWSLRTCDILDHCTVPRSPGSMPLDYVRGALWYCPSIDTAGKQAVAPNDATFGKMFEAYAAKESFRYDANAPSVYDLYRPRLIA